MNVPTSLELLDEFEAAKKTAQALFSRAAKNMPSAVGVTRQAIQEALGSPPYDIAHIKDNFSALVFDPQMRAHGLYLEAERRACCPPSHSEPEQLSPNPMNFMGIHIAHSIKYGSNDPHAFHPISGV